MKILSIIAAACAIAMLPAAAGSATAAPVAPNLSQHTSELGMVQDVQYRRWNRGWRSYAYAPRRYGYRRGYYGRGFSQFPAARCGDAAFASAYPSWACPANPRATGW
jgi:hypothetical protein